MSNAHRLAWIDAQIRAGAYPNAATVAARFEISRRQAARDIEYLRWSMGAPLEFCRERNGYRYTEDTFVLPALVVSGAERATLQYLAEQYESLSGEAAARVAAVLRRVGTAAVASAGDAPPVVAPASSRVMDVLRAAMESRTKVLTRYRGPDGVVVTRTIAPYAVVTRFGAPACVGFCDELGLTHLFAVARFERAEPTDELFARPSYETYVTPHRYDVPPQPFVAVVRLDDPSDAERLESATAQPDGTHLVEFLQPPAMLSALLSLRGDFEVLRPQWLRTRLLRRLRALTERNTTDPR